MNFAKRGDRKRTQQEFKKEEIFVKKCGQEINCFDAIQAANVDTNIYDVMKKYHCQQDEAAELMKARGGEQGIYADIVELQNKVHNLADMQTVLNEARQRFEELPVEIKQKYGNNAQEFYKQQEKIFKDLKELADKQQQKTENNENETK